MNMVFSRPILSDTQPKNGRVKPFRTRSIVAAKVTAVMVIADQRDRNAVDLPVDRDRLEVGGDHQAAGADDHEHEIHQPEDRLRITSVGS